MTTETQPLISGHSAQKGMPTHRELECGCMDPGTGRFLLVVLGALSLMVAGGLCIYAGVNSLCCFSLIGAGMIIFIIDLIVWQCKSQQNNDSSEPVQNHYPVYKPVSEAQASTAAVTRKKVTVDNATLEAIRGEFFEEFLKPMSEWNRLWIGLLNNSAGKFDPKLTCFIENYVEAKNIQKSIRDPVVKKLVEDFKANLPKDCPDMESRKENFELDCIEIFKTRGKGSCGVDALFGERKNGEVSCDAEKIRGEFADWLREENKQGTLPMGIKNDLNDFLSRWETDYVPDVLRRARHNNREQKRLYDKLKAAKLEEMEPKEFADWLREENKQGKLPIGIKNDVNVFLSNWEKNYVPDNNDKQKELYNEIRAALLEEKMESIRKEFRSVILNDYLNLHIKDTSRQLSQLEMLAIVEWKKLNLILIQPSWGEGQFTLSWQLFREGQLVDVKKEREKHDWSVIREDANIDQFKFVYYDGFGHYEQAKLIKNETKRED